MIIAKSSTNLLVPRYLLTLLLVFMVLLFLKTLGVFSYSSKNKGNPNSPSLGVYRGGFFSFMSELFKKVDAKQIQDLLKLKSSGKVVPVLLKDPVTVYFENEDMLKIANLVMSDNAEELSEAIKRDPSLVNKMGNHGVGLLMLAVANARPNCYTC